MSHSDDLSAATHTLACIGLTERLAVTYCGRGPTEADWQRSELRNAALSWHVPGSTLRVEYDSRCLDFSLRVLARNHFAGVRCAPQGTVASTVAVWPLR